MLYNTEFLPGEVITKYLGLFSSSLMNICILTEIPNNGYTGKSFYQAFEVGSRLNIWKKVSKRTICN